MLSTILRVVLVVLAVLVVLEDRLVVKDNSLPKAVVVGSSVLTLANGLSIISSRLRLFGGCAPPFTRNISTSLMT